VIAKSLQGVQDSTSSTDASGTLFRVGDAEVRVRRPARTVIVYAFKGRMVPEVLPFIRQAAAPLVAEGQ